MSRLIKTHLISHSMKKTFLLHLFRIRVKKTFLDIQFLSLSDDIHLMRNEKLFRNPISEVVRWRRRKVSASMAMLAIPFGCCVRADKTRIWTESSRKTMSYDVVAECCVCALVEEKWLEIERVFCRWSFITSAERDLTLKMIFKGKNFLERNWILNMRRSEWFWSKSYR